MKKELDIQLCEKYPELFRGRTRPMTETCMCWGFECGDGWFGIIDQLCTDISNFCRDCYEDVPEVVQVKEKFGGLRFYIGGVKDILYEPIYKLIDKAEAASYKTCEECGMPGTCNKEGWLRTRCPTHTPS